MPVGASGEILHCCCGFYNDNTCRIDRKDFTLTMQVPILSLTYQLYLRGVHFIKYSYVVMKNFKYTSRRQTTSTIFCYGLFPIHTFFSYLTGYTLFLSFCICDLYFESCTTCFSMYYYWYVLIYEDTYTHEIHSNRNTLI